MTGERDPKATTTISIDAGMILIVAEILRHEHHEKERDFKDAQRAIFDAAERLTKRTGIEEQDNG